MKDAEGNEVPGLFEIESMKVNKDTGGAVDIGCGNEFGGGDDDLDAGVELVNNVIDETIGFNLQEVPLGKRDLKEYLGGYCKKVRQALKDDDKVPGPQVKAFTQSAPVFCKHLLSMYDELVFYTSESMDPDGAMVSLLFDSVNIVLMDYDDSQHILLFIYSLVVGLCLL